MKNRERFNYLVEQIEAEDQLKSFALRELYHLVNWIVISPSTESIKIEFVCNFIDLMIKKDTLIFVDFLIHGLNVPNTSTGLINKILSKIEHLELQSKKDFIERIFVSLAKSYKNFAITKQRAKWFYYDEPSLL